MSVPESVHDVQHKPDRGRVLRVGFPSVYLLVMVESDQQGRVGVAGDPAPNPLEQRLIDYVARGELLDLAGDEPVDETAMRSRDESRTIRAFVIRDIVRGRLVTDPDPRGLRLRGARIAGRIDLESGRRSQRPAPRRPRTTARPP